MNEDNVFIPTVPDEEKQNVYEETDLTMSPMTGVKDLKPIEMKTLNELGLNFLSDEQAFLLFNVLSPSECEYYIKTSEELGFKGLTGYRSDYRNNDRVVAVGEEISKILFDRISKYVSEITITNENRQKVGPAYKLEGTWKPISLNETWRMCRYKPGGHFAPHFDGNFIRNSNERSMKTFMLYLNGDFEGGTTNFVDEKQTLWKDEKGKYRAQEENILLKIPPKAGMAIIFNHAILHEGGSLLNGTKYIMRSDVMFLRQSAFKPQDPKEEQALKFYEEAERLETEGKSMEAMNLFRKSFKLWPSLETEIYSYK